MQIVLFQSETLLFRTNQKDLVQIVPFGIRRLILTFIFFSLVQEFTTSMYLRQEWFDVRLAHNLDGTLPLKGKDLHKIWRPDTYFTNNNDYKLYEDNQLALISKYGYVYYSAR